MIKSVKAMSDSKLHFSRDGIHTHLVLPSELLLLYVPDLKRYLEPYAWARVGWGDYAYYGAAHQPLRLALRALLVPTAAVIAVRGLANFGERMSQQQRTYSLNISLQQVDAAARYVASHFAYNAHNQLTHVREKPCGEVFFASTGTYLMFNTCNNWTSRGLKAAGMRCWPLFSFLPSQVEKSVLNNGYTAI